jgi:hypothetical protein
VKLAGVDKIRFMVWDADLSSHDLSSMESTLRVFANRAFPAMWPTKAMTRKEPLLLL